MRSGRSWKKRDCLSDKSPWMINGLNNNNKKYILKSCGMLTHTQGTHKKRNAKNTKMSEILFLYFWCCYNTDPFQSVVGHFSCCANIVSLLFFWPLYPRAQAWYDLLHTTSTKEDQRSDPLRLPPFFFFLLLSLSHSLSLCLSSSFSLSFFSCCSPSNNVLLRSEVTSGQGQILQQAHTYTQTLL